MIVEILYIIAAVAYLLFGSFLACMWVRDNDTAKMSTLRLTFEVWNFILFWFPCLIFALVLIGWRKLFSSSGA